jgi:threonine dehydratase
VHPFNGYRTVLGTATLGYEWATQTPDLDAVIVPIGGGGLAAGVSTALRLANPHIHVYRCRARRFADAMSRSFAANHTIKMGPTCTGIADSLMAPHTEQYSYELCRRHIDRHSHRHRRCSCAQRCSRCSRNSSSQSNRPVPRRPQRCSDRCAKRLQGKRVGVLLCGTNTRSTVTFASAHRTRPHATLGRHQVSVPGSAHSL